MANENVPLPPPIATGTPPAAPQPASAKPPAPVAEPAASSAKPPAPDGLVHKVRHFFWPPPPATSGPRHGESPREVVETVVFVVVLVLLLKSFVAEAFVIPTGSMATTLLGYHKMVTCPKCKFEFPVNCSSEVDPQDGIKDDVLSSVCPNCRYHINFAEEKRRNPKFDVPSPSSGDRVLVAKFLYDLFGRNPERLDVVVFKYPREPQKQQVPMNYIKRLIGLPGETIAIHYGNLYYLPPELSPVYDDSGVKPEDLWRDEHMHVNDEAARALFAAGRFQIVRKAPDKLLAMMRPVFDNDHQDEDPAGLTARRWSGTGWTAAGTTFQHPTSSGETAWLRYQHILRGTDGRPRLITDFMGYNAWEGLRHHRPPQENWVGDLILECEANVEQPDGELVLELSRGPDRFRARFDLATGVCTLTRQAHKGEEETLDSKPTGVKGKGSHRLRFANVDDRLTLWVDGALPFGDGVTFAPAGQRGPTENDLEPASVGVKGGVTVAKLKLFRDTYYTLEPPNADARPIDDDWSDPNRWANLKSLPAKTIYVQPGHFLCMGDNSPESSDGRSWGLVPERLMLGRALLVYYPFGRAGRIK